MTEESPVEGEASRVVELERRLAELEANSTARVIQSELRAHATKAGMIDLDGLKLVETAGLKLNDAGLIEGGVKLMADLRKSKPWLFHPASSSSSAASPPVTQPTAKRATDMSHTEWQAARSALLKHR